MFDTDKFIECVHDQPALWDKHLPEYSDRNEREKCWIFVGEMMYGDWLQTDIQEKDSRIKVMKNKWRHIRDNFIRYINQGKSGDSAPTKKKKYVYADALTFLLGSMEKRPTAGNISEDDVGTEGNIQEDQGDDMPVSCEVVYEDDEDRPIPAKLPKPASQGPTSKKISPFQSQRLAPLSSSPSAEEDPDRLYILSLLYDYKKLDEDEKLDFKMMNIQFFRSVRKRKVQQTSPTAPSQQLQTTNSQSFF